MSDHRIVVQLEEGAQISSPTVPSASVKSVSAPSPETKTSTISVQSVMGIVSNPVGAVFGKLVSAIPWVAGTLAVSKSADRVATTAVDMLATSTGDSSGSLAYSNFKLGFSHALNPVSYSVSLWKQQIEVDRQNKSIAQQRILMGNAVPNGIGKAGV